jgi:hypothetical protein
MHIVFQQEDVNTLSRSFDLDETLRADIFQIADDYAAGPLKELYSPEGAEARREWWRKVLAGGDYHGLADSGKVDDAGALTAIKEQLWHAENETLWIWVAPNPHDVSGYYWLMGQLKEFAGRILVLWLNNLPFINEKGNIFYPRNLYGIPPREFLKAKKLARPVTLSEFEIDPDEWTRICNENGMVRVLEGSKKLIQKDEDFYDKNLLQFVSGDWQKAGRVIHQFLAKSPVITGDAYLLWRLKELISRGAIDAQGDIKNMKDFEVKKKVRTEDPAEGAPSA